MRGTILLIILGLPAAALLLFGPRGQVDVPPGRTVVHYWEKWSGTEAQVMQTIVNEFNQTVGAKQNIWVDYNSVSNVDQRMLIATAGGDPPDVAGLFDYIIPQFAERGALMPLEDLIADASINLDDFKPIWLQIGRYEGTLYALPSTPYTIGLYYNRRLFREAGLDPNRPPTTTAELNEYAKRLTRYENPETRERIVQLGFTTSPGMLGWWHWIWPCFFDANMWDGQHFHIDTDAGRSAATWTAERRRALGLPAVLRFEGTMGAIEGAQNPFLDERLAMVFQGPWLSNWINKYTPDVDYAVAPFPSVRPDLHRAFASTDLFVIPTGAHHPREAVIFLEYVLQQDVLERLCCGHGKISPFRTPGPGFYAEHKNQFIRVFDEMASSPDAFGYPQMPTWAIATDELKKMHENILGGRSDPLAEVAAAQRRIDAVVSEHQRMYALRRGEQSTGSTTP
ncbi:MAG: extracellular solute-binding protein [Phycisphaerae bacterium]|nr:extracellular solute-binding protein [Phycisphaerae bacterium]